MILDSWDSINNHWNLPIAFYNSNISSVVIKTQHYFIKEGFILEVECEDILSCMADFMEHFIRKKSSSFTTKERWNNWKWKRRKV